MDPGSCVPPRPHSGTRRPRPRLGCCSLPQVRAPWMFESPCGRAFIWPPPQVFAPLRSEAHFRTNGSKHSRLCAHYTVRNLMFASAVHQSLILVFNPVLGKSFMGNLRRADRVQIIAVLLVQAQASTQECSVSAACGHKEVRCVTQMSLCPL